ncbi:MAG: mobile mystery protein B [Dehalococcoidia bacterium]
MLDRLVPVGDGHTALSDEDRLGLIPTYIASRGELFDAEQRNISEALLRRSPTPSQLLDDKYLRDLHRAMFGEVWRWAGRYRQTEKNIGIAWVQIPAEVRNLTEDARVWVEDGTYEPDELAVRFHHRLVAIHPFANGNGRHGRVAADYLVRGLGHERFSWGTGVTVETEELRAAYIGALQRADLGEIAELLAFARS